jgi:hypothetical protein
MSNLREGLHVCSQALEFAHEFMRTPTFEFRAFIYTQTFSVYRIAFAMVNEHEKDTRRAVGRPLLQDVVLPHRADYPSSREHVPNTERHSPVTLSMVLDRALDMTDTPCRLIGVG